MKFSLAIDQKTETVFFSDSFTIEEAAPKGAPSHDVVRRFFTPGEVSTAANGLRVMHAIYQAREIIEGLKAQLEAVSAITKAKEKP